MSKLGQVVIGAYVLQGFLAVFFFLEIANSKNLVLNPETLNATTENQNLQADLCKLQNFKAQVSQSTCSVQSLGTEPKTWDGTI